MITCHRSLLQYTTLAQRWWAIISSTGSPQFLSSANQSIRIQAGVQSQGETVTSHNGPAHPVWWARLRNECYPKGAFIFYQSASLVLALALSPGPRVRTNLAAVETRRPNLIQREMGRDEPYVDAAVLASWST